MNAAERAGSSPRQHVAIAIVERDGQYLVGKRPNDSVLAGYWEFPGGKVKPGETPREAAVRECLEETGWRVRVIGGHEPVTHDYDHARVCLHFFDCRPIEQTQPLPERFTWVAGSELSQLRFPQANTPIVSRLIALANSALSATDAVTRDR